MHTFQSVCSQHGRLSRGDSWGKAATDAAIHRSAKPDCRSSVGTGVCMTREEYDALHPDYRSQVGPHAVRHALVLDKDQTTILVPVFFE